MKVDVQGGMMSFQYERWNLDINIIKVVDNPPSADTIMFTCSDNNDYSMSVLQYARINAEPITYDIRVLRGGTNITEYFYAWLKGQYIFAYAEELIKPAYSFNTCIKIKMEGLPFILQFINEEKLHAFMTNTPDVLATEIQGKFNLSKDDYREIIQHVKTIEELSSSDVQD